MHMYFFQSPKKGGSVHQYSKNLFTSAPEFSVGSILIPVVATMTATQRIKAVCGKAVAVEFISKRTQYTCKCLSQ